ncbi:MAG: LLM class flavin-dependent oxidoreductase [Dehalococcoidia bacterium]|nr:LLM class flavin-dependent oxidoreductase [Dehalococcoidia bacterium]
MKVRLGLSFGAWPFPRKTPDALVKFIDRCDEWQIDSLWFSDRLVSTNMNLDPITTMAFVAARSKLMKFGPSAIVLGTRHPVPLAQQLATLDFLSQGRLLVVVGIGSPATRDLEATGVKPIERARRADESIALMRKLWSEDHVTYHGKYYQVDDITVYPKPWQKPGPPIWIGGKSDGAYRRTGYHGDGWLVGTASPAEVAEGVTTIKRYAAEAGRAIPEDHFGAYVQFRFGRTPQEAAESAADLLYLGREKPIREVVALGTPDDVRRKVNEFVDAGATKLVMRAVCRPEEFMSQVETLAREVIAPLQTPFSREEILERAGKAS